MKTIPHAGYTTMRVRNYEKPFGRATYRTQRWGETKNNNYFVVTSNVDGHYAKSSYPAEKIYECHACLNFLQCNAQCPDENWSTSDFKVT
jgi:NAD-dependent SIR2 family protein deacetylase